MPHLHMELQRRKALAVRLTTAAEVEGLPLPGADVKATGQLSAFLDTVNAAANSLEADDVTTFEASLHKVARDLEAYAFHGNGPAIVELNRRRDSLVRKLRAWSCWDCVAGTGLLPCEGKDRNYDDSVVDARGACIAALREISRLVREEVEQLYATQAKSLPPVQLRFATEPVHRNAARGLFNEFGISGWTDLRDGTVGLEIKDRAFDRKALCQALYVRAHEMVCHAFQGLQGMARRQNADETCSWSEGWMDRLAFLLTEHWLDTRRHALPDGLRSDIGVAKEVCSRFHRRRYEPPLDPLEDYHFARRDAARWAFDHLRGAWTTIRSSTIEADHRVVQFSLRLNLKHVAQEDRETICQLLTAYLVDEQSARYGLALAACSAFLDEHDDAKTLLGDLEALAHG
jgi:hypothetical protein